VQLTVEKSIVIVTGFW